MGRGRSPKPNKSKKMQYRRSNISGGSYFLTLITHNRQTLFHNSQIIDLLRTAFRQVKEKHPFTIDAIVILPDHLHCLLTFPDGDANYAQWVRMIKGNFSRNLPSGSAPRAASRVAKGEKEVWQRRYWEHLIRDETDFERHVDYIHYNPVKHGLAAAPKDWPWSSFHNYVSRGVYPALWGADEVVSFGEDVGSE
ncbi:MAG: transposase [Desulfarculus sp.]|nr:transposase [Desulfarculus sp.]MBV1739981.1 transposase [Desulfarculus sp.]